MQQISHPDQLSALNTIFKVFNSVSYIFLINGLLINGIITTAFKGKVTD